MKLFKSFALLAAMTVMFAASAVAAPMGNLIPKVNSFDFLVDYSGSMMMNDKSVASVTTSNTKMNVAKAAMKRVNDKIPALGYGASLHTFAPVQTVLPQGTYDRMAMLQAIDTIRGNLEVYGRYTPMGDSIAALTSEYNQMSRKAAIIMVTDGNSNLGSDPVAQVTYLYNSNPDLCVHVISLADTAKGRQTIKEIASLRSCSVVVEADDLISSDTAVDQFVRDVFYDVAGGRIDLRSVQFAFDSDVITAESAAILDEVARMLQGSNRQIEVAGHTCSIGTAEYNMGLSQRRANSVKNYLVRQGIPASSITARGYGESQPKFDNRTEEGRRLNRRAEVN